MELDVGVARQLEDFQWPGPVGLLATEASVLENLGRQGKPSGVARLASKAVQWILAFNWTKQLKVWANDARLGREYTQRAARIAWAAEIAAGLSRDTAQCAVELELQRRARRQPGARQSAALAARAALLAGRQGTVALIAANAGVRQAEQEAVRMELACRRQWMAQFGSLSLYESVGHHMLERMGWQVGSRLGKQHRWQRELGAQCRQHPREAEGG